MRIKRIETFCKQFVGFVRVTAEDGAVGWGQVATYNADITARVLHRQVAPWALGAPVDSLDEVLNVITEREYKFPGSYLCRAIAGLDTAVWDLRGRRAGRSVCELLGGTPGTLRAYASSMKRDISPADEADRFLRLRERHGFDAFKFRVGAECGHDIDEWPGRTEEIVPTVRKVMGDEVALLVDANGGFSPQRAIEVGRMLADHGVRHFEEPCLYWEWDQTRRVAEALEIDVAGGEQDCDLSVWRHVIATRTVDIVQPDICYLGGINRTLQVAAMAAEAGLPCTPHCANLSLVTLFTAHLLKAIPNAGDYLELSIEGADYYPWQEGLFTESPYTVRDGQITVSDAPGWGVEINTDWLRNSTHEISENQ